MIQTICSVLSVVISIVAVYMACYIPKKIQWEQLYSSLLTEYISYDFAVANQSIVEFFYTECEKDIEKIKQKSEEHYLKEIYQNENIAPENCLHFQRRLLTDFYWLLNECANSNFIGKKRVAADFTKGDLNILKIIFLMNGAVNQSEILYKNIEIANKIPHYKTVLGINRSLAELSLVLKKSKKNIKPRR